MNEDTIFINSKQRLKQANKKTIIGSIFNVVLSLAKLATGIIGQSQAIVNLKHWQH